MAIHNWPATERPREKLLSQGVDKLSNAELLALLLRTGNKGQHALALAQHLLNKFGSLRGLMDAPITKLNNTRGIGPAKSASLQAVMELNRRYLLEQLQYGEDFSDSLNLDRYLISQLRHQSREVFAVVFLSQQQQFLAYHELFYGSLTTSFVHPREVVKQALSLNAAAVIFAHNHPYGDAKASQADIDVTQQLRQALSLVEIEVWDHIIIGTNNVFSFVDGGLLD